jgi:hypothetical protein
LLPDLAITGFVPVFFDLVATDLVATDLAVTDLAVTDLDCPAVFGFAASFGFAAAILDVVALGFADTRFFIVSANFKCSHILEICPIRLFSCHSI